MNNAPVKTPPLETDQKLLSWPWQRWFSDLTDKIKELEERIKELENP